MEVTKGVFDPFCGFRENSQNWPQSKKEGEVKKISKKLLKNENIKKTWKKDRKLEVQKRVFFDPFWSEQKSEKKNKKFHEKKNKSNKNFIKFYKTQQ